jgi:hypothetical protein
MQSHAGEWSADRATKTCPECRDTLVFSHRYPVLSVRTLRDGSRERGIGYEKAWVCRNGRCDYRELIGER